MALSSLDAELALERIEATLAVELPPHVRAFAAAHAAGRPVPPAPELLSRVETLEVARRAIPHPALRTRGLALLRLAAPLCRDAHRLFGMDPLPLTHRLHGAQSVQASRARPGGPVEPGWKATEKAVVDPAKVWRGLAERHGAVTEVRFVGSDARPRTFVVSPTECIVVVPERIDSPAARFALMHELGHVLAAALSPPGIPRALDEAVAAFAALSPEPLMISARARRFDAARALDAVERGLTEPVSGRIWALANDPGAQAAYILAESLADELARAAELRPAIETIRERIDRVWP